MILSKDGFCEQSSDCDGYDGESRSGILGVSDCSYCGMGYTCDHPETDMLKRKTEMLREMSKNFAIKFKEEMRNMTKEAFIDDVWGQVKAFCQGIVTAGLAQSYDINEITINVVKLPDGRMYPKGGFTATFVLNQYTSFTMDVDLHDISENIME